MTNNAQLLPLPVAEYRLSPDSKPSLYDADQMRAYALACIDAAKPADALFTTGHCAENAKPGGCQRHNLQCGYPDCDRRPAEPTCKQTLQVDALGSLPVVAKITIAQPWCGDNAIEFANEIFGIDNSLEGAELTFHAQATAEIAKRDAVIAGLKGRLGEFSDECFSLKAKLAGVDGLVEALRKISDTTGNVYVGGLESVKIAREALDTYEAAQGEKK